MMKRSFGIGLVALAMGLTGCNKDFGSAEGVLETAYAALLKDDFATYFSTLSEESRAELAGDAKRAWLRGRIEGRKLRFGVVELERRERDAAADPLRERRFYAVTINGRLESDREAFFEQVLSARVVCDVRFVETERWERTDWPHCQRPGYYPRECKPDHQPGNHERYERLYNELSDCRILALEA
jgi:hypothetical protein